MVSPLLTDWLSTTPTSLQCPVTLTTYSFPMSMLIWTTPFSVVVMVTAFLQATPTLFLKRNLKLVFSWGMRYYREVTQLAYTNTNLLDSIRKQVIFRVKEGIGSKDLGFSSSLNHWVYPSNKQLQNSSPFIELLLTFPLHSAGTDFSQSGSLVKDRHLLQRQLSSSAASNYTNCLGHPQNHNYYGL